MSFDPLLGPVGLFLLYGAPGLGIAAALFPEKFRRRSGWEELVEMAVLAVVGSVTVTILLGALLAATPGGFAASWNAPALLALDALIGGVGGAIAVVRRGAAGSPEGRPRTWTDDAAWPTVRSLEAMAREERRLTRSLRHLPGPGPERSALESQLDRLRADREALRRAREVDLAS